MEPSIFSVVPVEVWSDRRLSLEQMRVLGALLSFCGPDRQCWPSRQQIAERAAMHVANVSAATTELERLGWLEKTGKGGYSKATRYTIKVPATVADQATVAHSATVADPASPTVAESATRPLAYSATRKELTSELTSEQTKEGDAVRTATSIKTRAHRASLPTSKPDKEVTFAVWCEQTRAKGEKLISQWEPLKDYAKSVKLPSDYTVLAWNVFRERFESDEKAKKKRYINWRMTFLNYVKNNYLHLWAWSDRDGCFVLTTAGLQADREQEAA